ncbi:hypothetical protein BvCmsNSP009_02391 [Escherichia coli]|nr:hypothetical protein BvCmsNSP009_02391 [Escherichia coli]
MESTPKKAPRSKFPALLVVALALVAERSPHNFPKA